MKTIRYISAILIAVTVFFASCKEAKAVITPPTYVFPTNSIGTVQKVGDTEARSVNDIGVYIWKYDTNGVESFYTGITYESNTTPTNKYQLDKLIIVPDLVSLLHGICTNKNPNIDKSRGVFVEVTCDTIQAVGSSEPSLYSYNTFQFIKNTDGSYSVPDLSGYSTELNSVVPFYISNLKWARVEVGDNGDSYPFEVDDVLYDPGSNPVGSDGFLYLNTSYITDSSSSNGDFWMKITLYASGVTNVFQIYNGDGNSVPETPMKLGMSKDSSYAYVTVSGGDSGKGFVLQWSSDLKNWTNGPVNFFSPLPEDEAFPPQFYWPLSLTNKMFFRTATTNAVPY